jgi:hypothetical protein
MTIKNLYPSVRPTLDLNFAQTKQLDPRITFSRSSSGTYFDNTGVLRTASANQARFDHDPVTGESLGLLVEEARSNLLLNSGTLATQSVTVTATAYWLSFYGTGSITLSGASTAGPLVGTGTNDRVVLGFTPTAGTLTLSVAGTVTNAQLEAGSFPTSYIPTAGSTVTRAADVAQMTGTNFSSWYSQNEGTVFVETKKVDDTGGSGAWYFGSSGAPRWWSYSYGYTQAYDGVGGSGVINTLYSGSRDLMKYAAAISNITQTHVGVINGGSVVSGGWDSIVGVTQLDLGFRRDNNEYLNGRISRFTYFPNSFPGTTLQALTL